MKLYWQIAKNTWDQAVAYRASFVIYRLRNILWVLTLYFLWIVVLPENTTLFGYNRAQIITYVLGTSLLSSVVLATRSQDIASDINEGNLSNFLLRPMGFFRYHFARDLGDKAMNISFAVVEIAVLFFFLRPPLFLQTNLFILFLTLLAIAVGVVLFFFFGVLLGLIGFWSNETWGPRFIFYQLLTFFAGNLFPLDILPKQVFRFIELLPFPYLLYFPMKVYLGQLAPLAVYKGISIAVVWVFLMYGITRFVWLKGLRVYTAQGR
ncbi:MAG: ABC-2 family transporter protein [Candidatus Levybacteria bacterium]|nr:ABC-2 family transporter protein [Candidatus Levybacteria bacterium]